jgi:hypothetical protein
MTKNIEPTLKLISGYLKLDKFAKLYKNKQERRRLPWEAPSPAMISGPAES